VPLASTAVVMPVFNEDVSRVFEGLRVVFRSVQETKKLEHFDFFIFGHRHLPIDVKLADNSRYINLGEWIKYDSYAVFNGENVELKYYKE